MDDRDTPLFTFGVIADIQYADMDNGFNYTQSRERFYRSSITLLRNALRSWSASPVRPRFVLQLGDIIDGFNKRRGDSDTALERVLTEFGSSDLQVHHVWGNHEFYNFSREALLRSPLNSSPGGDTADGEVYAYHFSPFPGFAFVVLDAYDVSLLGRDESTEDYKSALKWIQLYNSNSELNCPPVTDDHLMQRFTKFNGAFGKNQLAWLDSVLSGTDSKEEKVTIVSHLPVHPTSTSSTCLAWNFDELLAIIHAHPSVVCFIAGHDHDGGYHWDTKNGVHHVTLEGVIETPPDSNAFGTVSVYEDRMVLKGAGRIPDRVLLFAKGTESDTKCNF